MPLVIATTTAFCLWITLWAIGISGFDGLLLCTAIVLIVAGIRALGQFLPGADRRRLPGRANAPQGGW
ncbi:hypothetical protein [Conexibacter arvalis]|uniref:Uncharacterized protein n=1 Tax=Conexibacter arvalis TaxID=912552 RepID=A0A840IIY8_9ACTN|nr:hypothetical protein [Conexibacter arvalis]MBB4663984.1 hypothetical protein [Conexibacter arvalis]